MIDFGDGPCAAWIRAHFDFPHKDWCLIWPFARSQNGYANVGSDRSGVHRVMCEHRHGPAPTPEHYAAHSCDRGGDGCVNPWHVDWKTPSENQFDRHKNGEVLPARKITADVAREIRDLKGLEPVLDLAARFGVSESNVRLIQAGKTWRADRRDSRIFTRDEVELIRATPWQVKPAKKWAAEFGVNYSVIERIRAGKTYRYFLPECSAPSQLETPDTNR
jgi:hypothetical protein